MSALSRKARGDLQRNRARTILTVCTLSLAIGSLATVAVPGLMNSLMQRQVQQSHLYNVAVTTHDVVLSAQQASALRHLPNVAAFNSQIEYSTSALVGSNRSDAILWGLNFGSQSVDSLQLTAGQLPGPGQVLSDGANAGAVSFASPIGSAVSLRGVAGSPASLVVSGVATSFAASPSTMNVVSPLPVFYASESTVRSLSGVRGVNYLAFRLVDNSPSAQSVTIAEVRTYLKAQTGIEPFISLPLTLGQGDWPLHSKFNQLMALIHVITMWAVVSALFLIANTMNTLVVEQSGEIAILKTLGARRRQIARVILRSAAYLGGAGAVIGSALGVGIAYLLTRFLASSLFGFNATFALSVPVIVASLVVGPIIVMLASLPGLRRALRRPVSEVLVDRGVSGYGNGRVDRILARSHLLSGPTRMGVRNVLRKKRRSAATIAQVAIAVSMAISFFAIGRSISVVVSQTYTTTHFQVQVSSASPTYPFTSQAVSLAASTPGVTRVEPVVESTVQYNGGVVGALGLGTNPLYQYHLTSGRWFKASDSAAAVPVVVLGPALARSANAHTGMTLALQTPAGITKVRVIGIDSGQMNNGSVIYFPLSVLQRLNGLRRASNALWISTANASHRTVDAVSSSVQSNLDRAGFSNQSQRTYVLESQNQSQNNQILSLLEVLGVFVVLISLIGLVSTLTMGIIERRREIGVLRCLGAKSAQVRRVFVSEGIALAMVGWVFGAPIGWLVTLAMMVFIRHDFGLAVSANFPLISVPVALVGTLAVTMMIIRVPLRRATRIRPSDALRYE